MVIRGVVDLEKHFAFYGAYHSNPVNVLLHMIFVWPIYFTTVALLDLTPSLVRLPISGGVDLNFSFFFTLAYAVFYVTLDRKAGSLGAVLCLLCWIGSHFLTARLGFSLAWKVIVPAQLLCWAIVFCGHGVFEKRAPALLDNFFQSFIMAPFFVVLEALQRLLGYEPYPGFHGSVSSKIEMDRKQWQARKLLKKSS